MEIFIAKCGLNISTFVVFWGGRRGGPAGTTRGATLEGIFAVEVDAPREVKSAPRTVNRAFRCKSLRTIFENCSGSTAFPCHEQGRVCGMRAPVRGNGGSLLIGTSGRLDGVPNSAGSRGAISDLRLPLDAPGNSGIGRSWRVSEVHVAPVSGYRSRAAVDESLNDLAWNRAGF